MVSSTARIAHNLSKLVLKPSWLLLLVIPVAVAGVEVTSYQTANAFSLGSSFWGQFLLFGILLPLSIGLAISILSLTNQEQAKTDDALHQLRLAREINGSADRWDDLVDGIDFPSQRSISKAPTQMLENAQTRPHPRRYSEAANIQDEGSEPHDYGQDDLGTYLLDYAWAAGSRAQFSVELTFEGQACALPPHPRRQLLFICQEAITHIEEYAGARHVQIHLTWRISELTVKIRYDGQGFDLEANHSLNRESLSIMRERASEVEGQVWVTCSKDTGSEIVLRLPLQLVDRLRELKSLRNHGINRNCQVAG